MNTTPLFQIHEKLNAKFTEFNGWNMPLWFSSLEDEHLHVRNQVGIFDVSHMGEIEIAGDDAESFTDFIFTNNILSLKTGQARYGFICDSDAQVLDDVIVYKISNKRFFLCVNAGNKDSVYEWLFNLDHKFNIEVKNLSNFYGQLAVQGPKTIEVINKIFPKSNLGFLNKFYMTNIIDLEEKFLSSLKAKCPNGDNFLIARTGYTGEDGYEIFVPNEVISSVYEYLLESCNEIKPCGLASRDTLRIEAGFPLHGNELIKGTTPVDFNLNRFIDFKKPNFIGKEVIEKRLENKKYVFVGFMMADNSIARSGYDVLKNDTKIGFVTSGTFSPVLKKGIGFALLDYEHSKITEFEIRIRKALKIAQKVDYPFIR